MRSLRLNFIILLFLALVVLLVRLPSLAAPLDNDSGAVAYHATLINAGEPLYSTHRPTHHLPGIFYTYALIFKVFGNDIRNIKLALMFWVWINSLLVFYLGEQLAGRWAGFISAIIFIIATSLTQLQGETGEMELFANLPLTLIMVLAFEFLRANRKPSYYLLTGAVGAICFLYKPVYLSSLGTVMAILFFLALQSQTHGRWQIFIRRYIAIGLGFLAIIALISAYFVTAGVFDNLILSFKLGTQYVGLNQTPTHYIISLPLGLLAKADWVLAMGGLLSMIWLIMTLPRVSLATGNALNALYQALILLWGITSIIIAGASKNAFGHYALLLVPPFSLLAIMYSLNFLRNSDSTNSRKHLMRFSWGIFLLIAIMLNSLAQIAPDVRKYSNYLLGKISYSDYRMASNPHSYTAERIADYVAANSSPSDSIFGWTDSAQIYYLAKRRSVYETLWPSYIGKIGTPEIIMAQKPLYVIAGPILFRDATLPAWLNEWLSASYKLETVIGDHQIFRRFSP